MSISYCGLNCIDCDIHKIKLCSGCKVKKKDWGCAIRKCAQQKNISDCCKCGEIECRKYKKIVYKISRPFMPFDLENNRKNKLNEQEKGTV